MEICKRKRIITLENLWLFGVFILYITLLAITILRHEPWSDEGQAWLLARDASLKDLFFHYLRYEGSPGLWHLILMIPAKLHMPYFSMQVLSGFIACFGVFVFLKYAPFPKLIKTIFPFTFFILYQYAAIARAYVLFPTLFFLLAMVFHSRRKHPYVFFGLLTLIATVSLHGTIIAIGVLLAHYIDVIRSWDEFLYKERKQQIALAGFFMLLMMGLVIVLWVPKDYYNIKNIFVLPLDERVSKLIVVFSDVFLTNILCIKHFGWTEIILFSLALFIWFVTFKLLSHRHLANYFVFPLIGLSLLFSINFLNPWHTGVLFIYWFFLLWISFKTLPPKRIPAKDETKSFILAFLPIVLLMQCYWSYNALKFDWYYSYSGGRRVAEYIKSNHLEHKKIFVTQLFASAFTPFFEGNIIANAPDSRKSFIVWTFDNTTYRLPFHKVYEEQPDLIVIRSTKIRGNYRVKNFLNYRFIGIFNGALYWKNHIFHPESYLVFKRYKKLATRKISKKELTDAVNILNINYHPEYLIKTHGPIMGSY